MIVMKEGVSHTISKHSKKNLKKLYVTEEELSSVEKSKVVAIDCEMVGVGLEGSRSALARVCIVNWYHRVILDRFVKVEEPVTDYRTIISGICSEDIYSCEALSLDEVRIKVQSIIKNKILVGHGLKSDLQAIGLTHPWYNQRDTTKFKPYMKIVKHARGEKIYRARKLRDIARDKLGILIQSEGQAHCPIIDANTALNLYKLSLQNWEKLVKWKVQKTNHIISQ